MAHEVTDATFEQDVLKSDLPVVVDFWAPWCGPCKAVSPLVEELGQELDGKIKVAKMNVDENSQYPGMYSVMSIPTFIIFKNGEPVKTFVGARSKEDMRAEFESALAA
jgi:thioredoxin 1